MQIRTLIGALFILLSFGANAQLTVDKKRHDFGQLAASSERWVDFKLTNKGSTPVYILRHDTDRELAFRYSDRTVDPNETVTVRVQFNPSQRGAFNKNIVLYHSGSKEPFRMKLTGKVMFTPGGSFTPCPDFNRSNEYDGLNFEWTVHVQDSVTGAPIRGAQVNLVKGGLRKLRERTNREGMATGIVLTGSYYLVVSAEDYVKKEGPIYLNRAGGDLWVKLVKKDPEPLIVEHIPDPVISTIPDPFPTDTITPDPMDDEEGEEPLITTIPDPQPIDTFSIPGELDRRKYAPNNVVFVIDVSGSMRKQGKLDLLKLSMIELLGQLRDVDRIAIVTYAGSASLKMGSRSADQKAEITTMIEGLEASGGTQGGKGLKLAYQVAQKNFINDGNNIVIMATDGAFGEEDQNLSPLTRRYARKGIRLSVVGVRNAAWTERSLKPMAKAGEGRYLRVEDYEQAKPLLLEEIKLGSKRR